MIDIRCYKEDLFEKLIELIKNEGDEWSDYTAIHKQKLYLENLRNSICYLLYKNDHLIGYIRAFLDTNYAVYICDLLIDKNHRGNHYGALLINEIKKNYQDLSVYVMSDVDLYYQKENFKKIGSIFEI
jgi:hypothetical protein